MDPVHPTLEKPLATLLGKVDLLILSNLIGN